jgi:Ricin-type beta-trefoil lectin domain-like
MPKVDTPARRKPPEPEPQQRGWLYVLVGAGALAVVVLLLLVIFGVRAWRSRQAVALGRDAPPLKLDFLSERPAAPTAPMPVDGAIYVLENHNSGRCLSVEGNSTKEGAKIVQGPTPEEAGPTEEWQFRKIGEGFRLTNRASGKVLEVPGSSQDHGVRLIQWHVAGGAGTNQQWQAEAVGDYLRFRAVHSGQCLCVGQGLKTAGAVVIQWDPLDDVADQLWTLRPPAGPR